MVEEDDARIELPRMTAKAIWPFVGQIASATKAVLNARNRCEGRQNPYIAGMSKAPAKPSAKVPPPRSRAHPPRTLPRQGPPPAATNPATTSSPSTARPTSARLPRCPAQPQVRRVQVNAVAQLLQHAVEAVARHVAATSRPICRDHLRQVRSHLPRRASILTTRRADHRRP